MNACRNLGVLDQRVSDAVKVRRELDLRIGDNCDLQIKTCIILLSPPPSPSSLSLLPLLSLPLSPSFSSLPSSRSPLSPPPALPSPSLLSSFSGSAFTRFQTKFLTKAFPLVLSEQLISYGPCQFPTLGFVVERVSELGKEGMDGEECVSVCVSITSMILGSSNRSRLLLQRLSIR